MIGRFDLSPPPIDDSLSRMVETHRSQTGQDYAAILFFGLWGMVDCSPEVRLYAAYRHLAASPEDGSAWLETSRVYLEAGELDKAESILDELVRLGYPNIYPNIYPNLYSEDPEAHRVHLFADSGRLDQALEALDALRVKHDESPVYHYILGTVLHEQKNFTGASSAYAEALEVLENFHREVAEERMEEELDVDFPAAAAFLKAAAAAAEKEREFDGERPMDLSGFGMEIEH